MSEAKDQNTRPVDSKLRLNILLADDDTNLRAMLAIVLRRDGDRVEEFRNGEDLRSRLQALVRGGRAIPRELLIVSDLRMPEVDALTVFRTLRQSGYELPFILMTAFGSEEAHRAAAQLGALAVLDKPFDFDDLREVVRRFARSRGAE
jgi:DNA-binding NtrC family response regulator